MSQENRLKALVVILLAFLSSVFFYDLRLAAGASSTHEMNRRLKEMGLQLYHKALKATPSNDPLVESPSVAAPSGLADRSIAS